MYSFILGLSMDYLDVVCMNMRKYITSTCIQKKKQFRNHDDCRKNTADIEHIHIYQLYGYTLI